MKDLSDACRADNLIHCTVICKIFDHWVEYLDQCGQLGYWTSAGGSWPWQIHHKVHGQVQITGEQQHKPVTRQKIPSTISTKNIYGHRFFKSLDVKYGKKSKPRITYNKN